MDDLVLRIQFDVMHLVGIPRREALQEPMPPETSAALDVARTRKFAVEGHLANLQTSLAIFKGMVQTM